MCSDRVALGIFIHILGLSRQIDNFANLPSAKPTLYYSTIVVAYNEESIPTTMYLQICKSRSRDVPVRCVTTAHFKLLLNIFLQNVSSLKYLIDLKNSFIFSTILTFRVFIYGPTL